MSNAPTASSVSSFSIPKFKRFGLIAAQLAIRTAGAMHPPKSQKKLNLITLPVDMIALQLTQALLLVMTILELPPGRVDGTQVQVMQMRMILRRPAAVQAQVEVGRRAKHERHSGKHITGPATFIEKRRSRRSSVPRTMLTC